MNNTSFRRRKGVETRSHPIISPAPADFEGRSVRCFTLWILCDPQGSLWGSPSNKLTCAWNKYLNGWQTACSCSNEKCLIHELNDVRLAGWQAGRWVRYIYIYTIFIHIHTYLEVDGTEIFACE